MLHPDQILQFIQDGYIKLENAFPAEWAEEGRSILWKELNLDPNAPSTWKQPVVYLGERTESVFIRAANTPLLQEAFDQLVGKDNWQKKESLGSFPIRFPCANPSNDTGWHVDASFPGLDAQNYLEWRININSKARGLLMLFLFSDVGEKDAPTLLQVGSHLKIARILQKEGPEGLSFLELAKRIQDLPEQPTAEATGKAGTVFLCHPFLIHAAQQHRGAVPKFMAQPALFTKSDFILEKNHRERCPVERAIHLAIGH